jgi:hypothetical protein
MKLSLDTLDVGRGQLGEVDLLPDIAQLPVDGWEKRVIIGML